MGIEKKQEAEGGWVFHMTPEFCDFQNAMYEGVVIL
jgi:hypothetical protein